MKHSILVILDGWSEKPSVRLRVLQAIPKLQENYQFGFIIWKNNAIEKLLQLLSLVIKLPKYDLVYIHKCTFGRLNANWINLLLRVTGKPLVFDFDDAIYAKSSKLSDSVALEPSFRKPNLDKLLHHAAAVIVGNSTLAEYASKLNSKVFIIPTVLDVENLPKKINASKATKIIGWIGTNDNLIYLDQLMHVLDQLGQRFDKQITLRVITGKPFTPNTEYITIENIQWALESEVPSVLEFDIGIMPLSRDAWARGKSGFKAIFYQSLGIPVVITPHEVVLHGQTGFHATNDSEWIGYLSVLISNDQMREEMGKSARRHMESCYNLSGVVRQMDEIFSIALLEKNR